MQSDYERWEQRHYAKPPHAADDVSWATVGDMYLNPFRWLSRMLKRIAFAVAPK
jgi:hypothetical protein